MPLKKKKKTFFFIRFTISHTQYCLNTITTQIPINIDAPDNSPLQEWVETEWINNGKKYPISGEVPTFIQEAHSKTLAMPPICSAYIPSQHMSIADLLKATLPAQSSAIITHSAARAFNKEEPNEELACLKTRPIPPKYWLEEIDKEFGQAWFDGARSLEDKQFKGSRVALCAQSYWKEMRIVIEK